MFTVKSVEETLHIIKKEFSNYPKNTITIKAEEAFGYVISKDVVASENIPPFNRSTMDGYAVKSNVVKLASTNIPVVLTLIGESHMGKVCNLSMADNETIYVPTGGNVPNDADAVVQIENTEVMNDEIFIYKHASHLENIFEKGTDISKGSIFITKNTMITHAVIGALKSLGVEEIEVFDQLKISIISTGDEITDKTNISLGEIRDINTYTIKSYLERRNVNVIATTVIKDNLEEYKEAVRVGLLDADIVISSGGSSVGEKDYTIDVLNELELELLVHGVSIKPGKPTIIGKQENKMFFGLPGQPTSAYIVLNTLFPTVYNAFYDLEDKIYVPYIDGVLDNNVRSAPGRKTHQLVKLETRENILYAIPIYSKSGMINSLKNAYGYVIIEALEEGISKGETIKIYKLGE